jgi:hypothetical protein
MTGQSGIAGQHDYGYFRVSSTHIAGNCISRLVVCQVVIDDDQVNHRFLYNVQGRLVIGSGDCRAAKLLQQSGPDGKVRKLIVNAQYSGLLRHIPPDESTIPTGLPAREPECKVVLLSFWEIAAEATTTLKAGDFTFHLLCRPEHPAELLNHSSCFRGSHHPETCFLSSPSQLIWAGKRILVKINLIFALAVESTT